jgi:hypothetical protein
MDIWNKYNKLYQEAMTSLEEDIQAGIRLTMQPEYGCVFLKQVFIDYISRLFHEKQQLEIMNSIILANPKKYENWLKTCLEIFNVYTQAYIKELEEDLYAIIRLAIHPEYGGVFMRQAFVDQANNLAQKINKTKEMYY